MAAITTTDINRKQKAGFARRKQLSLRIDMTPMVDLGFLLITFFIFTSTMSQPTTMGLNMPKEAEATPIKESGALTILPTENGKIFYYDGILEPANVHTCSLKEIRNVILNKKRRTPEKNFFIVIKPTVKANYGNVVDILDEMTISNVKRYALADISQEEKAYMN